MKPLKIYDNHKPRNVEELYITYAAPVRDYLYRMSGDREISKDLTQEVFYRATRALLFKPDIEYVSAWLYKIARNLFLAVKSHLYRARLNFKKLYEQYEQMEKRGEGE